MKQMERRMRRRKGKAEDQGTNFNYQVGSRDLVPWKMLSLCCAVLRRI